MTVWNIFDLIWFQCNDQLLVLFNEQIKKKINKLNNSSFDYVLSAQAHPTTHTEP